MAGGGGVMWVVAMWFGLVTENFMFFVIGCVMLMMSGCSPAAASGEKNKIEKVSAMPCDISLCGSFWRYVDAQHGVVCYISTSSGADRLSCVKM